MASPRHVRWLTETGRRILRRHATERTEDPEKSLEGPVRKISTRSYGIPN
ncbi:hypothetical protein ACRALDRAFT_208987 [Sodiomyces alcalophilus JCM 7366]